MLSRCVRVDMATIAPSVHIAHQYTCSSGYPTQHLGKEVADSRNYVDPPCQEYPQRHGRIHVASTERREDFSWQFVKK